MLDGHLWNNNFVSSNLVTIGGLYFLQFLRSQFYENNELLIETDVLRILKNVFSIKGSGEIKFTDQKGHKILFMTLYILGSHQFDQIILGPTYRIAGPTYRQQIE